MLGLHAAVATLVEQEPVKKFTLARLITENLSTPLFVAVATEPTIEYINPAMRDMTQYDEAEAYQTDWIKLFDEQSGARVRRAVRTVLERDERRQLIVTMVKKDRSVIELTLQVRLVRQNGSNYLLFEVIKT